LDVLASEDPEQYALGSYFTEMDFGTYFDLVASADVPAGRYTVISSPRVFDMAPELLEDVDLRDLQMGLSPALPRALVRVLTFQLGLWIGQSGNVTTMHFDVQRNLSAQISGRKRWLLYPPEQSALLYSPWEKHSTLVNYSPVNPDAPDLSKHPQFADARAIEAVVNPGEMIFVPPGWWHHVRTLESSIMLSYFWWSAASIPVVGRCRYDSFRVRRRAASSASGS
jgi:lysine-specific demethylase 8